MKKPANRSSQCVRRYVVVSVRWRGRQTGCLCLSQVCRVPVCRIVLPDLLRMKNPANRSLQGMLGCQLAQHGNNNISAKNTGGILYKYFHCIPGIFILLYFQNIPACILNLVILRWLNYAGWDILKIQQNKNPWDTVEILVIKSQYSTSILGWYTVISMLCR